MSRLRLALTLVGVCSLALGLIGPASADARTQSKYGGTLVVGLGGGDPGSLDPTVSVSGSANQIYYTTCLRLYASNSKQETVPSLAAALPVLSKDKLSYTIQLRPGIQFNDGTPFNAQAVVTSVRRFMTYPGSMLASDYASVDSVSASGPLTVVYHLKERDAPFTGANPFVLSPTQLSRLGDNFGTAPVCVGPFMFDHRVVGDNVTVIKSPYYYDQKDVFLDKIVYKPMPDAAAATAALGAGDIQVLDQVSTTELEGVQQDPSLRVIRANMLGWTGLFINLGNRNGVGNLPYVNAGTPLAASAKLRQAFEEAIDRDALNRVVYGGLVQTSCTPISPANTAWYEATNVPCASYDPRDAKKLVAASGFPNPTVHLLTRNTSDFLRLAQFVQAQEAAVGINVMIDSTDTATATALATAGTYDVFIGRIAGGVDPSANVYAFLATSGARNFSGYSNPRLDLVLANGLKATDRRARSTLYRVAQQIIQNDRPIIVLYSLVNFAAVSMDVAGVQVTGNGTVNLANARFK